MDAIALLKADHKTVETLFRKFEQAGRNARKLKRKLVDQMVRELAIHSVIEEQVFYPSVRTRAEALEEDVLEALEEHHVVKWLLKELENLPAEAERFEAKVKVLMENVRTHVKEEERVLLPQVRKAFSPGELKDMAEALMLAKKASPTRPHPRAPDTPPGNLMAGAMSAVLDMGKDALRAARRKVAKKKRTTPGTSRNVRHAGNGSAREMATESSFLM
ncbi:hemerythrin domain-containing protein [Vitiosangium sp. GDMCC 1.1324]|uniref:hemerythrin domain-containing protein n=1 Tax=Vitiosangium sp. (strain GDMCC 1.1324) TaxID=2138576 RepID=UPI000D33424B|nr:hemerythrin domain-containing protein [Vitiosangium sp. GDMCC 1.1324]PTL79486.1 hemerythrin HHE cation-binding protein [Vitiosangium sp. GDMCC 1.1324]